jgi:hypothetical protein
MPLNFERKKVMRKMAKGLEKDIGLYTCFQAFVIRVLGHKWEFVSVCMSVMVLEIFVTSYLPLLEFCFQLESFRFFLSVAHDIVAYRFN